MTPEVEISLGNFKAALKQLEQFIALPVANNRDRAGIIHAFEFSFETAWKTVQKAVEKQGLNAGSPKLAFKAAFQVGWIKENEQESWTQMLEDRNLTTHTYKEDLASLILERICNNHVVALKLLLERMSWLRFGVDYFLRQ